MEKSTRHVLGNVAILCVCSLALVVGCAKKPQTLGYIGGLSGKGADLGISGRNGTTLAVEQRNAAGGIRGTKVSLEVGDDLGTEEGARAAFLAMEKATARVIVGPMTSAMSLAVLESANRAKILLISPTASSGKLTGLDDWFTRVNPPDVSEARDIALDARSLGVKTMTVVLDYSNREYSEGEAVMFRKSFEPFGTAREVVFTSGADVSYAGIARAALEGNPDGVMIIANTLDTANICQSIRKAGSTARLWGTGWAMTAELGALGGASVDGMRFSHYFDAQSDYPLWVAFRDSYKARFGTEPDFFAGLAWVAARVGLDAMAETATADDLKQRVLSQSPYEGLQGELRIDAFGDADLERFTLEVREGRITGIR